LKRRGQLVGTLQDTVEKEAELARRLDKELRQGGNTDGTPSAEAQRLATKLEELDKRRARLTAAYEGRQYSPARDKGVSSETLLEGGKAAQFAESREEASSVLGEERSRVAGLEKAARRDFFVAKKAAARYEADQSSAPTSSTTSPTAPAPVSVAVRTDG
jgi:hypothetical protein